MTVVDPPVQHRPFPDVPVDHPDVASVRWVTRLELLEPVPGQLFRVGAPVARQELARALYRYAGYDDVVSQVGTLPRDVAPDHPYAAELRWAVTRRVLALDVGRAVRPARPARRSELVAALHRAAGSPVPAGTAPFRDVPGWHGAHRSVAWATEVGLLDDDGSGLLRPSQMLSRLALAVLLHRFDELA